MKKLLLVPFILVSFPALCQYDQLIGKDVPLIERFYVGGGFGLGFSSFSDYVAVSPNIGYRITERGSIGIGVLYQYRNYKAYDVKTDDWGGSIFTRYKVFGPAFAAAEYEYINFEFVTATLTTFRGDYSSFMVGAGIAQPITRNVSFIISAMYNLTYRETDGGPYSSPWNLRVGISAGF